MTMFMAEALTIFNPIECSLKRFKEEERAECLAFIVFRMPCYCKYYVTLPRGVVGWSAVCDCGFPDHTHLLLEILECKSQCYV